MKLEEIELGDIRLDKNFRSVYRETELNEMMGSIKEHGQKTPVEVVEQKGKYILTFGFRRFLAIQKLGWVTIKAIVISEKEATKDSKSIDEYRETINIVENYHRSQISIFDLGLAIKQMQSKYGLTPKEVAVRLSMDIKKVNKALDVAKYIPKEYAQKTEFGSPGMKIGPGRISATVASLIADYSKRGLLKATQRQKLLDHFIKNGCQDRGRANSFIKKFMSGNDIQAAAKDSNKYTHYNFKTKFLTAEMNELQKKYEMSIKELLEEAIYDYYGLTDPANLEE